MISPVKRLVRSYCRQAAAVEPMPPHAAAAAWKDASSIAVLCMGGIGDTLMATPLLAAIRSSKPDAVITAVGLSSSAPILATDPNVDDVIALRRVTTWLNPWATASFLSAVFALKRRRCHALLVAQPGNNIAHSLLAGASRAPLRLKHAFDYGVNRQARDYSFLYHLLVPETAGRHRVEMNLDLLRALGETIPENTLQPACAVTETAQRDAEQRLTLAPRPRIAIHAGTGRADKRWPISRFADVAADLRGRGCGIVLVGGPGERGLHRVIDERLNGGTVDLAGQLSLGDTAAVLRNVDALVSNDSGVMHMAAAVGTPVVALFGPTDPQKIGPRSPNARVIRRRGGLNDITPDDVLEHVLLFVESAGS